MTEADVDRYFVKNIFFKILQNPQENIYAGSSLQQSWTPTTCSFTKDGTPALVLSTEFCNIFTEQLHAIASETTIRNIGF